MKYHTTQEGEVRTRSFFPLMPHHDQNGTTYWLEWFTATEMFLPVGRGGHGWCIVEINGVPAYRGIGKVFPGGLGRATYQALHGEGLRCPYGCTGYAARMFGLVDHLMKKHGFNEEDAWAKTKKETR